MGEVIKLNLYTKVDLNAADILRAIADDNPEKVLVITWNADGKYTFHSSTASCESNTYAAQLFIHKMITGEFE